METWEKFNQIVNELLLADGLRRGRGVEKFRDRMISHGVRDLQRFIPQYRSVPTEIGYTRSDLELHSEGHAHIGDFDYSDARIIDIVIRKIPDTSKGETTSTYFRPQLYTAKARYNLLDGGSVSRSAGYQGKIVFDNGKFYTSPLLGEDEVLSIKFNQEVSYPPLFEATTEEKSQVTPLGQDAALAVYYYVKYHSMKDVNDEQKAAAANFQNYQRERRSLFDAEKYRVANTSSASSSNQTGGFVVGNG